MAIKLKKFNITPSNMKQFTLKALDGVLLATFCDAHKPESTQDVRRSVTIAEDISKQNNVFLDARQAYQDKTDEIMKPFIKEQRKAAAKLAEIEDKAEREKMESLLNSKVNAKNNEVEEMYQADVDVIEELSKKEIDFTLGDEKYSWLKEKFEAKAHELIKDKKFIVRVLDAFDNSKEAKKDE